MLAIPFVDRPSLEAGDHRLKKLASAVAAGILVAAPLAAPAPASADTPGCVSHKEFRIADNDPPGPYVSRTKAQVERLFDTHGRVTYKSPLRLWKIYRTCQGVRDSHVCVHYDRHSGHWFLNQRFVCGHG
jgi:hypothetical protein